MAALPVIMLAACKPEDEPQITPKGDFQGLSENGIVAPAEGMETELTFRSAAAWRITSQDTKAHASFFTISPAEGEAGDVTVKIKIDPNTTTETRSGKFTIISLDLRKEITVSQAGIGEVLINSVVLDKTTATLEIGETVTLTATVGPENATEDKTVTWSSSNEAVATVADGVVTAVAAGTAEISAKAGVIVAKCVVTVNAPVSPVQFPDWSGVEGVSEGTYTMFKFSYDDEYVYFYTERAKDDRFSEIWGGAGYVYLALDLDNNMETGETLWGNGPYEFVGVIYPFGGSADAPEINAKPGDACLPETATLENVECQGTVDASGVKIEYRIPRADLPALTESFDVYSWGNKGFSKVKIHVGEPVAPPEPEFDYTPSDEYLSDANLWKAVADANAEEYFYRMGGNEGTELPHLVKNQSTYRLYLADATAERWNSQFFIHPAASNAIALEDTKIYKLKVTFQSTATFNGFIKLTAYDANSASGEGSALYEWPGYPDNIIMTAGQPYVLETELKGKSAANISFTMDFGGNPADAWVFIKDIVLVQTGEVSPFNPITEWDYTPSEAYESSLNLWKPVDAANTLEWAYNPGWQAATTPVDVKFTNSTYEFTFPEGFDGEWQTQLWIHPTAELNLDVNKKYNFSLTYYSETAASPLFKLYKKGEDNLYCFSPRPDVAQYQVYDLEETEFTPCEGPLCLLIDFRKATAGSKVYIKDIVLNEVGAEPPAPAAPKNIAEIVAAIPDSATGNNTAVEFDIDLENPVTVAYMNTTASSVTETTNYSIYIEDESGAMLLYIPNPGIAPGVTIKGKFHVKAYWFNGTPEIVSFTPLENPTWGQVAVPLHEVTIAELLANYDQYFLRKCKVTGITITDAIADGDRNGKASDGTNEIAIYAQLNNKGLVLAKDAFGDLVCIPGVYNTNKQLLFWQNDWFIPGQPSGSTGEDLGDTVDVNPWN